MTIYINDSHDLIGIDGEVPERPECNVPMWDESSRIDAQECRESIDCPCHQYESRIAALIKSGTPFEEPEKAIALLQNSLFPERNGKLEYHLTNPKKLVCPQPGFYTVDLGKTEKIWQYKNHEHYWWGCSPVYANTVPHYQYRQVIRILESKEEPMNKNYTPEELLEYHELNELIKTYEGGQSPPAHKLRRLIFLESKIKSKPLNESIQPHHLTDAEIEAEAKRRYPYSIYQEIAFVESAKWYRDKIEKK